GFLWLVILYAHQIDAFLFASFVTQLESRLRCEMRSRMARFWWSCAMPQPAISSRVRKHPWHSPVCGSIRQMSMQGEGTPAPAGSAMPGRNGIASPAGRLASEEVRYELAGFDHLVQVDPGLDAHPVQHVQHILGGDVAGRSFGIRATAQAGHGRMENRDARFQAGVNVGQGLAIS